MRDLKPLTERVNKIEHAAAAIIDVADAVKSWSKNRRRRPIRC
jgi:hypothetical protein